MHLSPSVFYTSSLRSCSKGSEICQILAAAINRADPETLIRNNLSVEKEELVTAGRSYNLAKFKRILILGAGKASIPMAEAVSNFLGNHITSGIVITRDIPPHLSNDLLNHNIKVLQAGHPIPDQRNLDASAMVYALLRNLHTTDLVICLISGGGSALLTKPSQGISLNDMQATSRILLRSGAEIGEFNTVRKHIDNLKGGQLAKLLYPATVLTLVLSDVVGDPLDMIASGPTVADPTTFQDAWSILEKYQILDQVPFSVRSKLINGISGNVPETTKPDDPLFDKVENLLIGTNTDAVQAAIKSATHLGYSTGAIPSALHGEASLVGKQLAEGARYIFSGTHPSGQPVCLVGGGETTVTLQGEGKGGRNQELSLGAVEGLRGMANTLLASLATDGIDGPTEAAGTVVTDLTYQRGLDKHLHPAEYLARNDSYNYFKQLDDLIITGPTFTNVNDLVFMFAL